MKKLIPLLGLSAIWAACGCGGSGGSDGADVFAVNAANQLLKFDLDSPAQVDSTVSITGVQGGEVILAIDFRPNGGALYGLGSFGRLYTINTNTGVATQVGAPFTAALSGINFGFDFDPVTDTIRITSDNEQNLRVNPVTGIDTVDTNLTPGHMAGIAYDNNFNGAASSTLYAIDPSTDMLRRIGGVGGVPSPNGGVVTDIAPLTGLDVLSNVGFDIMEDGTAVFMDNPSMNLNDLYTLDLTTGNTTFLGTITTGGNIIALAVRN